MHKHLCSDTCDKKKMKTEAQGRCESGARVCIYQRLKRRVDWLGTVGAVCEVGCVYVKCEK